MGVLMMAIYLVATSIGVKSANAVRMMCGCIINTVAVLIFAWRGALVYRSGVANAARSYRWRFCWGTGRKASKCKPGPYRHSRLRLGTDRMVFPSQVRPAVT
jgi:hypothetical protein